MPLKNVVSNRDQQVNEEDGYASHQSRFDEQHGIISEGEHQQESHAQHFVGGDTMHFIGSGPEREAVVQIGEDEDRDDLASDDGEQDGLTEPNIMTGEKEDPRGESEPVNPDEIVLKPPLHAGKRPPIQLKVTRSSHEIAEQLLSGTFSARQATKEALVKQRAVFGVDPQLTERSDALFTARMGSQLSSTRTLEKEN